MDLSLIHNLIDPAILFFFFGLFAAAIKSNLEIPAPIAKFFSLYLLIAIGFKGGVALSASGFTTTAVLGIGAALLEGYEYTEGDVLNPSFLHYKIPTALEMTEVEAVLVEEPHHDGPFGAKGVGETSNVPLPPAISNAIYDAVGVRIKDLPITPEKVLRALRKKTEEQQDSAIEKRASVAN